MTTTSPNTDHIPSPRRRGGRSASKPRTGRSSPAPLVADLSSDSIIKAAIYDGPSSIKMDTARPMETVTTALPALLQLLRASGLGLFVGLYEIGRRGAKPRRVLSTAANSATGGYYELADSEAKKFKREAIPRVTFTGRKTSKLHAELGVTEYYEVAPVDTDGKRIDAFGGNSKPLVAATQAKIDF